MKTLYCMLVARRCELEGQSEGAGMTTAPAGKLRQLLTQRSAKERRKSRLKPGSAASAAAMSIVEKTCSSSSGAAALELLEQGFRLKKLRSPSRSRLKKLGLRILLKRPSSTQGSGRKRRVSRLKPCPRRRCLKKLGLRILLKKTSSTQGSARKRRVSRLKPCPRRRCLKPCAKSAFAKRTIIIKMSATKGCGHREARRCTESSRRRTRRAETS